MKQLLMGNEAIARGAVEAGIDVATAYPGTPSSEVFMALAKMAPEHGFYAEYSANEKVALEVAAGAAYAGARSIVSMKQVGLNVAADPLMSLAYIGVKGGLVLVVADDPGPHSSQTEQDTRKFGQFAKLPVFNPGTPQEAKDMTLAAFETSEKLGLPVILRPTTRTCHVCQDVEVGEVRKSKKVIRFEKDPKWVIMPKLSYLKHQELNVKYLKAAEMFETSPFNESLIRGNQGIITTGVSYNYVMEALEILGENLSVLKIGTYPIPEKMVTNFLKQMDTVLVVEEQEPVLEDEVIKLAWKNNLRVDISGKHNNDVPREGELDTDKVMAIIRKFLGLPEETVSPVSPPELPLRPPTLCAGCPHRASFYVFKKAVRKMDAIFTGDIGCYTLGNAPPLEALDTCLCMGAGVTQAQGLKRVEPERKLVAFIGDSTFFHTGIPGLINAVYNQTDITVVILDNRTTAMTGFQPHPGLPQTAMGTKEEAIDLEVLVKACGVRNVYKADPYDLEQAQKIAARALEDNGPSVVIMKRECVHLVRPSIRYEVETDKCNNCGVCYKTFGCPALFKEDDGVKIMDDCNGCSVCSQICPSGAIKPVRHS
ncbi:indolepyruvate ferredoxin oxidoreductase subunit alpha [Calderihabitans maritimus]|uniref:Indolepyruvate oxidoreductase subunit IorA n=1 Tax=Calderihabitans maritimus TaxID=1246530 RepID=A0A1Z5HSN0_9FIRM|nr:indolepyruvate ferredoxin oxidoreductase subunit alpha [Calderihabitans maritimus]GAW92539.1 indolepyruvate ferredoxin oxidoreductase subunit alpha [Calderihabitans maritimus]